MNRRVELWNDKKIASTLTVYGTIRTAVGRNIWIKISKKNLCEEAYKTSVAFLNSIRCSTGSQCNFLSTGVILVYRLVFDTILVVLFGCTVIDID